MSSTTLTMGFTITVDEDASKGTVVAMCEDMASMLGEGHALRPLGGRKGLLSWHKWPGRVDGVGTGLSGKEMRLLVHGGSLPRTGLSCVSFGGESFCLRLLLVFFAGTIGWAEDVREDRVMEEWRDDESVALRKGRYRTQLASFGGAPRWRPAELEVIREVMQAAGWRVTGLSCLRGLRGESRRGGGKAGDPRYYPQA